jgi:hypothetical protein
MEGKPIAHTFTFKYLGFYFDADNDQSNHINQRMGQASDRFRSLMHIWTSNKLPITLKRRIYCSAVISVLTYGHLVLLFDDKVQKRLNGFNARCLATIYIGHRIVLPAVRIQRIKEHSVSLGTTSASGISGKRTYDLVAHLRAQRLRWLPSPPSPRTVGGLYRRTEAAGGRGRGTLCQASAWAHSRY